MLTEVLVETLTVLTAVVAAAAAATAVCLGRGGGVGACRNCRGHSRGLSGPEPELLPPLAAVTPLGPVRDDGDTPAELTTTEPDCCWPTDTPLASCTRAPSRGLQGAELEPKSLASRVIGSRICERRRADDDEPRISSIVLCDSLLVAPFITTSLLPCDVSMLLSACVGSSMHPAARCASCRRSLFLLPSSREGSTRYRRSMNRDRSSSPSCYLTRTFDHRRSQHRPRAYAATCDKRNFFPYNMLWKFFDMLEKARDRTTTRLLFM